MKNLLKIIIMIGIAFAPGKIFAQENVMKDFSAPKTNLAKHSNEKKIQNSKITINTDKKNENNKPKTIVSVNPNKRKTVNNIQKVSPVNTNKTGTKATTKTVAVIKLKKAEIKSKIHNNAVKHVQNTVKKTVAVSNKNKTVSKDKPLNNVVSNSNKTEVKAITNITSSSDKSATYPVASTKANSTPLIPQDASHLPTEYIYKEAAKAIDNIDPTPETATTTYYPGLRGTNQLIIYTPNYGQNTGTNEFGTEAIVIGNTVVQMNGADSIIPKDGFIISGHGSAKKWINENAIVGSKIFVDIPNNKVRSYLTPDSFIFAAKEKIREANSIMEYYRSIDVLYDDKAAVDYILKSKELLRKAERDQDKAQIYITQAMDCANLAIKNALPYKEDELKGVWVRPTETTPEEIVKTIDHLQNIGITNVFLETYFHGKTIYPSQVLNSYGVTNQREEFVGFDPLRIWVDECHKRNMKIHIWFETFYVGNQPPCNNVRNVLKVYPNWANTTKAGYASTTPVASLSEHNGYFLDPANPEVQKYLLDILTEIITNYCPDGINLDYIRYPQSIAAKFASYDMANWGYTTYAREEFKNLYCIDPLDLKYNNDGWDLWARYRQDKVTKFVAEAKRLTSANNIMLTTVVFPDRQKSLETKMQDWRTWSLNNLVDGFTPLILTSDKVTAASMIGDIKSNAGPCTKIYPGLFVTFMGGSFDDLLMQIQETRKLCANGIVLFDFAHLDQKYIDALKTRVYNQSTQYAEPRPQRYIPQRQRWFRLRRHQF